ncbi:MAG: DUF2760 domain-containing protein [Desulfosarcina sp.]|jgi:hypothetical protein
MSQTNLTRSVSLRTFFQSLFFSTLLFAIVACFYWVSQGVGIFQDPMDYTAMFVFFTAFGMLQWLVQKNTFLRLATDPSSRPQEKKAEPPASKMTDAERQQHLNRDKRLFVHLFSVMQREGRLMDFLHEDLSGFNDDQIGAAVRAIHENCKKTVTRYLSPQPIMKQSEGESVEIAAGFDRQAVKLVGNVVGQPPFCGVLRHRGWQLGSISLPRLSEKENPNLIAPAEVEIQ